MRFGIVPLRIAGDCAPIGLGLPFQYDTLANWKESLRCGFPALLKRQAIGFLLGLLAVHHRDCGLVMVRVHGNGGESTYGAGRAGAAEPSSRPMDGCRCGGTGKSEHGMPPRDESTKR
jgi:hypothetical protein